MPSFETDRVASTTSTWRRSSRAIGLISKRRESSYRGGRSDRWIKVKNQHRLVGSRRYACNPAFSRV